MINLSTVFHSFDARNIIVELLSFSRPADMSITLSHTGTFASFFLSDTYWQLKDTKKMGIFVEKVHVKRVWLQVSDSRRRVVCDFAVLLWGAGLVRWRTGDLGRGAVWVVVQSVAVWRESAVGAVFTRRTYLQKTLLRTSRHSAGETHEKGLPRALEPS